MKPLKDDFEEEYYEDKIIVIKFIDEKWAEMINPWEQIASEVGRVENVLFRCKRNYKEACWKNGLVALLV